MFPAPVQVMVIVLLATAVLVSSRYLSLIRLVSPVLVAYLVGIVLGNQDWVRFDRDLSLSTGAEIPIEERSREEMTCMGGVQIAPDGVKVWHPAFDVTPARLVTAIIHEHGISRPPYRRSLSGLKKAPDLEHKI